MNPDEKLYAALNSVPGGTPIGNLVGTRIYPVRVPANVTVPAIAYQRTSSVFDHVIHKQPAVLTTAVFDVFCLANDYKTAEDIGTYIEALNVDGVRVIDRSSSKGESEDDPFASIITIEVDV